MFPATPGKAGYPSEVKSLARFLAGNVLVVSKYCVCYSKSVCVEFYGFYFFYI